MIVRSRTPSSAVSLAGWLGLHALLLQLLLPIFHHPTQSFATPAELAQALVAMADAGMAHGVTHHGNHGDASIPACPLCLAVQHAAPFVPPTAPALSLPQSSTIVVHSAPSAATARWHNFAARARGPPQTV